MHSPKGLHSVVGGQEMKRNEGEEDSQTEGADFLWLFNPS